MAVENVFRLINIKKTIYTKEVTKDIVKNINFQVQKKEFVCIMGPTGCGKSSLLRIMAGLDQYTDGIMNFENSEVKSGISKNLLRNIGIAYQSDSLFEWLTVKQNIEQPVNVFGLKSKMNVSQRVDEMLELTGLKNYQDCYPSELSGGMRQRCAFGRALVHDPEILLLDQPFGALDAITRKVLGTELLETWHEMEKTVVMVTNNVTEALMLAQRVIVLSKTPATVTELVEVPLTYEERLGDLLENEKFLTLSEKLNQLIHV